jgi:RNA polymerase sigma factor (sigma-70 family)
LNPSESQSDAELVKAALAGDPRAFDALVRRHFGLVYLVGHAHLGHRESAEDLAQEVFLRAHLFLARLDPPRRFPAWVSRVARNLAIDWRRRGQTASRLLPLLPLEATMVEIPDRADREPRAQAAAAEERAAVRRAIEGLPALQRELVLLHHGEELSQREIAERLGMNQSTVSRQLKQALAHLRGTLDPVLRESVASLRPSARAVARTSLIAAAAGGLSASAKAALVAAAGGAAGADALAVGATDAAGLLAALAGLVTKGAAVMGTAKGLATAAAVIAVIGGGAYLVHQSTAPAPPGFTLTANAEGFPRAFLTAYALPTGVNVTRVPPPFIPARLEAYRIDNPPQAEAMRVGPSWMVVEQSPDGLHILNSGFGYRTGWGIHEMLKTLVRLRWDEIEGDEGLLSATVTGDFVRRRGTSQEDLLNDLQSIVSEAAGSPVRLVFRDVSRQVIVVRGDFRLTPMASSEFDVEIFGSQGGDSPITSSSGSSFDQILSLVGHAIHRRMVNEVTAPPSRPLRVGQRGGDLQTEADLVLQHLREQTGLSFTEETRTVRQLFVERAG